MYKITFKDRTVKLVTDDQGERVKQMQSSPSTKYVELDQNQYLLDSISKIELLREELPAFRLPEGPRCKGEYSIHAQIYELYKQHLATEGEHRQWNEFRDKAYTYLYTKKDKWCDNRKGTCYCQAKIDSEQALSVFPGAKFVS